jgi:hypothetical protein
MMKKMDKTFNATGKNYGSVKGDRTMEDIKKRRQDRWNFLFIAGMWFQDLFNYDFRRTEQCIIPYATQEGEISFCAYNTGVGWRNIIEKMHMTATLTKWYEEHGRHEIFAGGKKVGMTHVGHELKLNMEHVNAEANHTLDNLGIAKNAREEKIARARREDQDRKPRTPAWPSSIASTCWARSRSRAWFARRHSPASNNAASPINSTTPPSTSPRPRTSTRSAPSAASCRASKCPTATSRSWSRALSAPNPSRSRTATASSSPPCALASAISK